MGKIEAEVKMPTPQQLGRKNAEYKRLKDANIDEKRLMARMAEDAQVFGIPLDLYQKALSEIGTKTGEGKRAALAAKRLAVTGEHQTVASFLNEAIVNGQVGGVAVPEFQSALQSLASQGENWVLMTAFEKDAGTGAILCRPFDGGWNDGSNRSNQYADRPIMTGKSGKRVEHPFLIHGAEPESK